MKEGIYQYIRSVIKIFRFFIEIFLFLIPSIHILFRFNSRNGFLRHSKEPNLAGKFCLFIWVEPELSLVCFFNNFFGLKLIFLRHFLWTCLVFFILLPCGPFSSRSCLAKYRKNFTVQGCSTIKYVWTLSAFEA